MISCGREVGLGTVSLGRSKILLSDLFRSEGVCMNVMFTFEKKRDNSEPKPEIFAERYNERSASSVVPGKNTGSLIRE